MEVIFHRDFLKDLRKTNYKKQKAQVKTIILELESANEISQISNMKKLKGFHSAYRIRVGNYRIGLYYDENVIELARFVKIEDIYKVFP